MLYFMYTPTRVWLGDVCPVYSVLYEGSIYLYVLYGDACLSSQLKAGGSNVQSYPGPHNEILLQNTKSGEIFLDCLYYLTKQTALLTLYCLCLSQ